MPPSRTRTRTRARLGAAVLLLAAACSSSTDPSAAPAGPATVAPESVPGDACPVEPVPVVVSVDQWRDLVQHLGGRCATVTTVISGSAADPHDFEPSPADIAAIGQARLVVVNGLGYDTWASAAATARSPQPALVSAADAAETGDGDNPHLWYDTRAVADTAGAVAAELQRLLPGAEGYLDERERAWTGELSPLLELTTSIRSRHGSRSYAATESVFDPLAKVLGLEDATPPGYASAAASESDPAPGDIAAFQAALRDARVDVLVVNTQTEGSVPEQLRAVAEEASVPVVEVTETVPPGQASYVAWQIDQLRRLDAALSRSGS